MRASSSRNWSARADFRSSSERKRLEARLRANPSSSKCTSLAARLDALRQTYIESAEGERRFLKKLLEIAREVVQADREQVAEEGASAVADDATGRVNRPLRSSARPRGRTTPRADTKMIETSSAYILRKSAHLA